MCLLWNPWQGIPKAYRISVAMLALPALKPAPILTLSFYTLEMTSRTMSCRFMAEDSLPITKSIAMDNWFIYHLLQKMLLHYGKHSRKALCFIAYLPTRS